jgi:hypothetical protein
MNLFYKVDKLKIFVPETDYNPEINVEAEGFEVKIEDVNIKDLKEIIQLFNQKEKESQQDDFNIPNIPDFNIKTTNTI